jgi:hypothetical protein
MAGQAFTMLTMEPGPDVAPYHDRQIAILDRADWAAWLDPSVSSKTILKPLPAGSPVVEQVAEPDWRGCDLVWNVLPSAVLSLMADESKDNHGKRPPAPSVTERSAGPDLKADIAHELYVALDRLGASEELLAVVGSWRDTLSDEDTLVMLREFNATGRVLHLPQ